MALLPIYVYEHPVLRRKAKPVREVDDNIRSSVADMFETMHNANGVGLAANQVGLLQRIVVIDTAGTDEGGEKGTRYVLLNPQIVSEEGTVVMEEGCLSLPDIRDEVERSKKVTLHYQDLEFKERELTAQGLLGRVLQHEIDHLNGVLFIDHLGVVRRRILNGRLNKMRRGEAEATYPTIGARFVMEDPGVPKGPPTD